MGSSSWSDDHYSARTAHRAATAAPVFAYDNDVRTGKVVAAVHPSLNIKDVLFRESCDSPEHPNSRAVAVLLDVTGSMSQVPAIIQGKLPTLMGTLLRKAYLADPHIMVGAIGDANSDQYPIQIGQFESGIEIDEQISNILLEGGGGGSNHESYELAMYFMARHTKMDCFTKRGEKGYLFIIGDEKFYATVNPDHVRKHIGPCQGGISTAELVAELKTKFEVFFITPNMTTGYGNVEVKQSWQDVLGQNVLALDDPSGVCELIASTIAVCEGHDLSEISSDLKEAGTSLATAEAVTKALVPYSTTTVVSKKTAAVGGLVSV